jgi:hypothetical protein
MKTKTWKLYKDLDSFEEAEEVRQYLVKYEGYARAGHPGSKWVKVKHRAGKFEVLVGEMEVHDEA